MKKPGLCILAVSAGSWAEIEVFAFLCKSQLTSHSAVTNLCKIGVERYRAVTNRRFLHYYLYKFFQLLPNQYNNVQTNPLLYPLSYLLFVILYCRIFVWCNCSKSQSKPANA